MASNLLCNGCSKLVHFEANYTLLDSNTVLRASGQTCSEDRDLIDLSCNVIDCGPIARYKRKTKRFEKFLLGEGCEYTDEPFCQKCLDELINIIDNVIKVNESRTAENFDNFKDVDMSELDRQMKSWEVRLDKILNTSLMKTLGVLCKTERHLNMKIMELARQPDWVKRQKEIQSRVLESRSRFNSFILKYSLTEAEAKVASDCDTFHLLECTINRLGYANSLKHPWDELSAALGSVSSLLMSLARRNGITFRKYFIQSDNRAPYVENIEMGRHYVLYSRNGMDYFYSKDFELAFTGFLDCLQQLTDRLESKSRLRAPYRIKGTSIFHFSGDQLQVLKFQFFTLVQVKTSLALLSAHIKWCMVATSSIRPTQIK